MQENKKEYFSEKEARERRLAIYTEKNRFHVYLISVYFMQKINIQEPVYFYIPASLTKSGKSPAEAADIRLANLTG